MELYLDQHGIINQDTHNISTYMELHIYQEYKDGIESRSDMNIKGIESRSVPKPKSN